MTAPVSNGKFSFSVDSFYVEASGHNLHRRAPLPDLQALFSTSSPAAASDHVGHWYEAQLLHYGLPPSKTKAVAKMRLLDAVRGGNLTVPKDILKVETDLKKEWKKKDREAKAALKKGSSAEEKAPAVNTTKKRKKNEEEEDKKENSTPGNKKAKPAAAATKTAKAEPKAKAVKPAAESKAKKTDKVKTEPTTLCKEEPKRKQTAKKGDSTAPSAEPAEKKPRTKQTARCSGRGRGAAVAAGRKTDVSQDKNADAENKPKPRTKQTARCSRGRGGTAVGGRRPLSSPVVDDYDDDDADPMDIDQSSSRDDSSDQDDTNLGSLGLVNGEYKISSQDLDDWSEYPEEDFNLILSLAGCEMWGAYDFGMFSGIMHLPDRPYQASTSKISFEWRGRENGEGEMSFGPDNTGWIRFLGNGEIEGQIERLYGQGRFTGYRISGKETRTSRDVMSMVQEWRGYNATEYENESRRRWGGW